MVIFHGKFHGYYYYCLLCPIQVLVSSEMVSGDSPRRGPPVIRKG